MSVIEDSSVSAATHAFELRTVGIIGWGRMGSEMGRWLVGRGWQTIAFDPDPEAAEGIRSAGAEVATSSAELAAVADLVLLIVVDDAQVLDILTGEGGVIAAARPGTVLAICSSVRPETCELAATAASEAGVRVVDMALVGGERAAEQGDLTLLCGGASATVDDIAPALSAFATDVCHVGSHGAGQVAKSANNVLMWTAIRIDYEMLTMAKAWGVAPSRLRSILMAGTGGNQVLADWGLHRLRWPAKDLEVALALADSLNVDVPLVRALQPLMSDLRKEHLDELR